MTTAIRGVMRQWSVPGAIVGVWQQGQARRTRAFGARNKATRQPMTTGLYLRIGSETKTFTVTALLQLAERGRSASTTRSPGTCRACRLPNPTP